MTSSKLLRTIERRGKRAEQNLKEIRAASAGYRQKKVDKPSEVVQGISDLGRDNYKKYLSQKHVESIQIDAQKRIDESHQSFKEQLSRTAEELAISRKQLGAHQAELAEAKLVERSLQDTVDLMRQKMQRMQEREVESQRRLAVFNKFDPIFDALSERFNFDSPEEVITRLEALEAEQVQLHNEIVEKEEARAVLEREAKAAKQSKEHKQQTQLLELQQSLAKAEQRVNDLLRERAQQDSMLELGEEVRQEHLALTFGVVDLWKQWEKGSLLVDPSNKIDQPDLNDPFQVLAALQTVSAAHDPPRAGIMLRELASQANSLWMKFLSDETQYRMRPKQVLGRLAGMLDERQKTIERLQQQNATLKKAEGNSVERVQTLEREVRQLHVYIEQHQNLFRENIGRPRSSTHGQPTSQRGQTIRPHTVIGAALPKAVRGQPATQPEPVPETGPAPARVRPGTAKRRVRPVSAGVGIRLDGTSIGGARGRAQSVMGMM